MLDNNLYLRINYVYFLTWQICTDVYDLYDFDADDYNCRIRHIVILKLILKRSLVYDKVQAILWGISFPVPE